MKNYPNEQNFMTLHTSVAPDTGHGDPPPKDQKGRGTVPAKAPAKKK